MSGTISSSSGISPLSEAPDFPFWETFWRGTLASAPKPFLSTCPTFVVCLGALGFGHGSISQASWSFTRPSRNNESGTEVSWTLAAINFRADLF